LHQELGWVLHGEAAWALVTRSLYQTEGKDGFFQFKLEANPSGQLAGDSGRK